MYSSKEIIDIAVEIEDTGIHFYKKCSEKFKEENLKAIFVKLANEEVKHKELFRDMLKRLPDIEGEWTDEYYLYLKALGQSQVFTNIAQMDEIVDGVVDIDDIIKLAISAEKDSILWYNELKDICEKDAETVKILKFIINEERKHILEINRISYK